MSFIHVVRPYLGVLRVSFSDRVDVGAGSVATGSVSVSWYPVSFLFIYSGLAMPACKELIL